MNSANNNLETIIRNKEMPSTVSHGTKTYRCKQMLGKGTFGICFLASLDGKDRAIKASYCDASDVYSKRIIKAEDLNQQFRILYRQPNQVSLEFIVAKWMKGVVEGFKYLHDELRLVHRDLKLGNTLLDNDGNAIIADFGLSFFIEDGKRREFCGTKGFMAPEVADKVYYDERIDIYSFGAMIFILLTGKKPSIKKLDNLDFRGMSELAKTLVRDCLSRDPAFRPSFREIENYEFIAGRRVQEDKETIAGNEDNGNTKAHAEKSTITSQPAVTSSALSCNSEGPLTPISKRQEVEQKQLRVQEKRSAEDSNSGETGVHVPKRIIHSPERMMSPVENEYGVLNSCSLSRTPGYAAPRHHQEIASLSNRGQSPGDGWDFTLGIYPALSPPYFPNDV
ncbi:Serine/threonine-protein kinase plk1 [Linnemannia zychae]|nr:Serine/threonine-protein kinase plk1 [Linnemannia zychae]